MKMRLYIFSVIMAVAYLLAGCATVPLDRPKTYTQVITNTEDTELGKFATNKFEQYNGFSAFYPLEEGMDALGARLLLAEKAEKSIDLQYFLMKNDTAGATIAQALLMAADRGVRVRFLLDDVFTSLPDDILLLINQHPNIEIRIFNPVSRSGFSTLNFIGDFTLANRRMHNKSFTVDNSISVVGGRNIADEYFQLKMESVFIDFDILAVGPIAEEISNSFNDYWNYSLAVPIEQFVKNSKNEALATVRAEIEEELFDTYNTVYQNALKSQLLIDLIEDRKTFFPAPARVLSDRPDKLIKEIDESNMRLVNELGELVQSAEKEIIFISPYYIPGPEGVQLVRDLVNKGVRVVILTNSLASNNHVPVHSAYTRYRRVIIKAGAELYEARANAVDEFSDNEDGPDTLTLHTKAFFIDKKKLFIGSLNLDPRSIEINAEMGLLIDSAELVRSLTENGEEFLATKAYRVSINSKDELEWKCLIEGREVIEKKEPLTSGWLRFKAWLLKIAPESQL